MIHILETTLRETVEGIPDIGTSMRGLQHMVRTNSRIRVQFATNHRKSTPQCNNVQTEITTHMKTVTSNILIELIQSGRVFRSQAQIYPANSLLHKTPNATKIQIHSLRVMNKKSTIPQRRHRRAANKQTSSSSQSPTSSLIYTAYMCGLDQL